MTDDLDIQVHEDGYSLVQLILLSDLALIVRSLVAAAVTR